MRDVLVWSADHSALGYERPEDLQELFAAASRWLAIRHGWEPDPATFVALSDLVQGLHLAVHAFTEPGDGVIVQGPIYPPLSGQHHGARPQGRGQPSHRRVRDCHLGP